MCFVVYDACEAHGGSLILADVLSESICETAIGLLCDNVMSVQPFRLAPSIIAETYIDELEVIKERRAAIIPFDLVTCESGGRQRERSEKRRRVHIWKRTS